MFPVINGSHGIKRIKAQVLEEVADYCFPPFLRLPVMVITECVCVVEGREGENCLEYMLLLTDVCKSWVNNLFVFVFEKSLFCTQKDTETERNDRIIKCLNWRGSVFSSKCPLKQYNCHIKVKHL